MSETAKAKPPKGPIAELLEYAQKEGANARIEITDKSGTGKKPLYTIAAFMGERQFPSVQSKSVKEGKIKAAQLAIDVLSSEGEPICGVVTSWATPAIRGLFRKDSKSSVISESSGCSDDPEEYLDVAIESPIPGKHPVNVLQEYGKFRGLTTIIKILNHTGPAHSPTFSAAAFLGDRRFQSVQGKSKPEVRAKAASVAISTIDEEGDLAPWMKQQRPTGGTQWSITSPDGDLVKLDKHPIIVLEEFAKAHKHSCKFEILGKEGSAHAPIFTVCATLNDRQFPSARANRNKDGKMMAAIEALQELHLEGKFLP